MGTEPLEKENADLKRQLEERRNLAKKRFYADLLIYCLLEINLFAIMTQQWDVKLLTFSWQKSLDCWSGQDGHFSGNQGNLDEPGQHLYGLEQHPDGLYQIVCSSS